MMKKLMAFWLRLKTFEAINPDDAWRGRLLNILLGGTFLISILTFLATITILSIYSAWGQPGVSLIFLALIIWWDRESYCSFGLTSIPPDSPACYFYYSFR